MNTDFNIVNWNLKIEDSITPRITIDPMLEHNERPDITFTSWFIINATSNLEAYSNIGSNKYILQVDKELDSDTKYILRILLNTEAGEIVKEQEFTTPKVYIETPRVKLDIADHNSKLVLRLKDRFTIYNSNEEHIDTSWMIQDLNGKVVFESAMDNKNLVSIDVTDYLNSNSNYYFFVKLHTEHYTSKTLEQFYTVPLFIEDEEFDSVTTVSLDKDNLPIVSFTNTAGKHIKYVTLDVKLRYFPDANLDLLTKRYDNTTVADIKLTEDDMLKIIERCGDKLSLWSLPWIFKVTITYVDNSKSLSRSDYVNIRMNYNIAPIENIGKEYPVFKLGTIHNMVSYDKVVKVKWLVRASNGDILASENRSNEVQTLDLTDYYNEGTLVKHYTYYLSAIVTFKSGYSCYATEIEGTPFFKNGIKIGTPYVQLDTIEKLDSNLMNVKLTLSKGIVVHNPKGEDVEVTKMGLRLVDKATKTTIYSEVKEIDTKLVLSRSSLSPVTLSNSNKDIGIYYNKSYVLYLTYIASNGLVSTSTCFEFNTGDIPATIVPDPDLLGITMEHSGEINYIKINLARTESNVSCNLKIYKEDKEVYSKNYQVADTELVVKDKDPGLTEYLEYNREYWVELCYSRDNIKSNTIVKKVYLTNDNLATIETKPELKLFTYLNTDNSLIVRLVRNNLNIKFKSIELTVANEDTHSYNIESGLIKLENLYPNTEYNLYATGVLEDDSKVVSNTINITTKNYGLEKLTDAYDILANIGYKTGMYTSKLSRDMLSFYIKDKHLMNNLKSIEVKVQPDSIEAKPTYILIILKEELVESEYLFNNYEMEDIEARDRFYITVTPIMVDNKKLKSKVLEFFMQPKTLRNISNAISWAVLEDPVTTIRAIDIRSDKLLTPKVGNTTSYKKVILKLTSGLLFDLIDYATIEYNVNINGKIVTFTRKIEKPFSNYHGLSVFCLVHDDIVRYSAYRDSTCYINFTPTNMKFKVVLKDGKEIRW